MPRMIRRFTSGPKPRSRVRAVHLAQVPGLALPAGRSGRRRTARGCWRPRRWRRRSTWRSRAGRGGGRPPGSGRPPPRGRPWPRGSDAATPASRPSSRKPQGTPIAQALRARGPGPSRKSGTGRSALVASRGSWPDRTEATSASVLHAAGERPHLVQRRRERHQAVAAHPPVGRLQPHHAAERGRLADGAAGVGAQGDGHQARGHRGRGAAGRSAGHALEVPRVAGRAERAVLGGRAHGELVHVGLAHHDRARPARGAPRRWP